MLLLAACGTTLPPAGSGLPGFRQIAAERQALAFVSAASPGTQIELSSATPAQLVCGTGSSGTWARRNGSILQPTQTHRRENENAERA